MSASTTIRYLGWSNLILSSDNGDLAFDPFFSPLAGVKWANIEDFANTKVICLTHGHAEHYLDAHRVIEKTGAKLVSSKIICDRLHSQFKVSADRLIPVEALEENTVEGFKITAFEWYHRKINHFQFFGGDVITGFKFTLSNLLRCHNSGPYFGFFVESPQGLRLMNYTEGVNSLLPTYEAKELGQLFKPQVLVAGMQLSYENDIARVVAAVSPQTLVGYHPHYQLFEKMKLKSTAPEIFVKNIKSLTPDVEILLADPGASYIFPN